jgi:hypothetical protein
MDECRIIVAIAGLVDPPRYRPQAKVVLASVIGDPLASFELSDSLFPDSFRAGGR